MTSTIGAVVGGRRRPSREDGAQPCRESAGKSRGVTLPGEMDVLPPESLGLEHLENGLAARFLLAMPPRRRKVWREDEIPDHVLDEFRRLVGALREFGMKEGDEGPEPVVVGLSPSAKERWISFYEELAGPQASASGDIAAALSKLEATFPGWPCSSTA